MLEEPGSLGVASLIAESSWPADVVGCAACLTTGTGSGPGEGGRDNLLQSEIEGLHSQASAARSQAARLSSQLAKVQGSMETRLSALAAAFDAYVELGDVREQLAGDPDTSAVRRNATAAFEVLTRGGIPERLPDSTADYWLADAMNAVIALAAGSPDRVADARAVALDRDAELFSWPLPAPSVTAPRSPTGWPHC